MAGWMSVKAMCKWRDDRHGFRQLDGCRTDGWMIDQESGWVDGQITRKAVHKWRGEGPFQTAGWMQRQWMDDKGGIVDGWITRRRSNR